MISQSKNRRLSLLKSFSQTAIVFVILLGGLVLIGWLLDSAALKIWIPGLTAIVLIGWYAKSIDRMDAERKREEESLRKSEAQFRAMSDASPVGIFVTDPQGDCIYINQNGQRILGVTLKQALGKGWSQAIHPDDRERVFSEWYAFARDQVPYESEHRCLHKDGTTVWTHVRAAAIRDGQATLGYVGSVEDITARKRAEEELRKSREQLQDFLDNAHDLIQSVTPDGRFQYVNRAWLETLGYRNEEVGGLSFFNIVHPDSRAYCTETFEKVLRGETPDQTEAVFVTKDGKSIPVEGSFNRRTEDGRVVSIRAIFRNITERRQSEERLKHLGLHDPLTGLPNRYLFTDRLSQTLARVRWHKRLVAVLFVDLDRFKVINDTLGHAIGDLLLQAVAERLTVCMREGDTVARLGGDEFVIVLGDIRETQDVPKIAQKILDALSKPLELGGHELAVTASIGISLYPNDGGFPETLLKKADTAMYRAKKQGRNNYQFYSPT